MTINLSTLHDAHTAYANSGWLERFEGADPEDRSDERSVARFLRRECGADRVTEAEFNALLSRYAVEVLGWSPSDL